MSSGIASERLAGSARWRADTGRAPTCLSFRDAPRLEQRRNAARLGAAATAKKYAKPGLDDVILACLQRGEPTRDYAKSWADDYRVSPDAVERHIKKVKRKLN